MTDNFDLKIVYVLLDGVGDLPHPNLAGKTPLGAANTPNLDRLAKNGTICLLYTSPSPRDKRQSRMPSSA